MARLPEPGKDGGIWGDILNEYLSVSLGDDGGLKTGTIATQHLLSDAVTEAKLAPGVRAKLNATTEVQLRKTSTALEWRTSNTDTWEHLLAISDITGPQGNEGVAGTQGLKGDTGDTGPQGATGAQGIQGEKGDKGDRGDVGPQGANGAGVATGGTTGQVLAKSSNANYATQWSDVVSLLPSSQVTTLTNATGNGSSSFADAFRIIKITASTACRIRFYRSVDNRTADANRSYTTQPPTDGSLLAEFRWESPATFWASGFICNLEPGATSMYWRIDDGTATVTIEWVKESR